MHRVWPQVVVGTLMVWLVGAYLPAVSSVWVTLNVLVPAGEPRLLSLPGAYPAVGIDLHTTVSLIGMVLIIIGAVRWVTYFGHGSADSAPGP